MSDDKINDGGPAFPAEYGPKTFCSTGMTLRDWFAGQALVGMGTWSPGLTPMDINARAQFAYEQADAMLKFHGAKP